MKACLLHTFLNEFSCYQLIQLLEMTQPIQIKKGSERRKLKPTETRIVDWMGVDVNVDLGFVGQAKATALQLSFSEVCSA